MLSCPRGMKYNAQIGVGVNLSDTGEYNTSLSIKLTPTPEVFMANAWAKKHAHPTGLMLSIASLKNNNYSPDRGQSQFV